MSIAKKKTKKPTLPVSPTGEMDAVQRKKATKPELMELANYLYSRYQAKKER